MVESVVCYGCEVWLIKIEEQRKLLALEMDYLRRSARVSRFESRFKFEFFLEIKHLFLKAQIISLYVPVTLI